MTREKPHRRGRIALAKLPFQCQGCQRRYPRLLCAACGPNARFLVVPTEKAK